MQIRDLINAEDFEEGCVLIHKNWVKGLQRLHPEKGLVLAVLLGQIVELCSRTNSDKIKLCDWQFAGVNIFNRVEMRINTNLLLLHKMIAMTSRTNREIWIKPNLESIKKMTENMN